MEERDGIYFHSEYDILANVDQLLTENDLCLYVSVEKDKAKI